MADKLDDLDATREIANLLKDFETADRERILRWVREKLGLTPEHNAPTSGSGTHVPPQENQSQLQGGARDIKSFVAEKKPASDNQFAATVAHYYRFVAPEASRKESITAEDLQEACRLVGRSRMSRPSQTLVNAHGVGLLDKAGRGEYSISTVGENLVAVTLPSGSSGSEPRGAYKRRSSNRPKKTSSSGRTKAAPTTKRKRPKK